MKQEILNQKYTHVKEMLEIKNYAEFKHNVLNNVPNFKLMAKNFMQVHIKELTGQDIDPDHVRIYSGFQLAQPLATSYSGWQYWAPEKSLTLTELAFKNFNAHDQDLTSDDLKLNYGVYKDGPKEKVMYTYPYHYGVAERRMVEHFTEKDQVKILPSDLRKILNENDFYAHVKSSINTFWQNHEADMLILAKAEFVSKARRSMLEGVLSEDDYNFVMKTVVPNLPLENSLTMEQLKTKAHAQGYVYSLDINGYVSNDILRFVKNDGGEILYIPGERRPFEVFDNDSAMRHWIVEQSKDSEKCFSLARHFSLYDRQDSTFHTGVDNGLLKLASGSWNISGNGINKNNKFFTGEIFSTVVKKTKERNFSDADALIKSNTEVSWEEWLGYTKIANQIFGPIVGLCGAFGAVLATGAFVTQIGMEVHQAVTGDTEEERKQGFWAATIDIGTTLLFAGLVKFAEVKKELSELSESAEVHTEVNIDNPAEKKVRGFIKGINKSISVVKVGEDKHERDIWMRYDPITEKVSGRRYYRTGDGSDRLEPIPLPLSGRLNKILTEGLGGKGSKAADRNMAEENPEPTISSENSLSSSNSESSLDSIGITGRNVSLTAMSVMELAEGYQVKFDIFKMSFNNALKICSEANRIVKELNDTELTEELKKAFGEISFSPETINEFRENIEKLAGAFNEYNANFNDKFFFISSENMKESFYPENPPNVLYISSNNAVLINDSLFNLGNGMIEANLIRVISHSEKIKALDYFTLADTSLFVPKNSISDTIPLPNLETTVPDKLRHINYLLFQHLEDSKLALQKINPGNNLLSLVFGQDDALNHHPEEALLRILEDKDLLAKSLPFNADSLMQLVLHLLMGDLTFVDANELTIKNVDIEETKDLLYSTEGKRPIPYYVDKFGMDTRLEINGPIGELAPPDGLVIKPGEYYRWSDIEKTNPIRLDIIKISLKNSEKICSEVQSLVDAMNDKKLGRELSDAFSYIDFSSEQIKTFRENIKKLSKMSSFFSKEEYYKRYFCFFSSDDYQFRKGQEFTLPAASLAANKQAKAIVLITDTTFNTNSGNLTKTMIHEMSHFFGTLDNYYYPNPMPIDYYKLKINEEFEYFIEMSESINSEILTSDKIDLYGGNNLVQSTFGEQDHEFSDAFKKSHGNKPLFAKIVTSNADSLMYFVVRLFHKNISLTLENINDLLISDKGREKFPPLIVGKETSASNVTDRTYE